MLYSLIASYKEIKQCYCTEQKYTLQPTSIFLPSLEDNGNTKEISIATTGKVAHPLKERHIYTQKTSDASLY